MAVTIHSLVYQASVDARRFTMAPIRSELSAAKKLYAESRTDSEKYGASLETLDRIYKKGAIDAETYRRSVDRLNNELKNTAVSKDLTGTGQMLAGQVPGVNSFVSALKTIGPVGAAATLGIAGVTVGLDLLTSAFAATAQAVADGMERIDDSNDFAKRINISNEALAGLRLAAELGGVSAGELDSDLEKMLKNVDKAAIEGGDAAKAFERLGLDIDKLATQNPEKTFLDIADAVSQIESPYERARVAQEIFGRSGQALNTILSEGSEGLRRNKEQAIAMGLALDDVDAEAIAKANDELTTAKKLIEGATNALVIELAPAIGDISSDVVQLSKDFGGVRQAVSDLVHFAVKDLKFLADVVKRLFPGTAAAAGMGQESIEDIRARSQDLDRQLAERQKNMAAEERFGPEREDPEQASRREDLERRREEARQRDAQGKDAESDATAARRKADKLREQITKDMGGSSDPAIRNLLQERIAKNQAELDKLMQPGPESERKRPMGLGRNPFLEAGLADLANAPAPERDLKAEAQALADSARERAAAEGADLNDPAAREKAAKAVERIRGLADPAKALADAARETAERVGAVIDPAMQDKAEEAAQKIRDLMDPAKALANAARETAERMGATLDDPAMRDKANEIVERIRAGAGAEKSAADKAREALQKNLEQQQVAPELAPEIEKKLRKRAEAGASEPELRDLRKELEADKAEKEWEKEIRDGEKMANEAIKNRREAEKRMTDIEESGMSKEQLRSRKLQEDVDQLNEDAKTLGMSEEDRAAAEEQLRKKFDEDMAKLTPKPTSDNRALRRGSAEAFSSINRAMQSGMGIGSDPNKKVEENTKKTADNTLGVKEALEKLNRNLQNQQAARF